MVAKRQSPFSAQDETRLMTEMWDPGIADDPYAWVMFTFPWGQQGTPLENFQGPRKWQERELKNIANHIAEQRNAERTARDMELPHPAYQDYRSAKASGRGPGKSTLMAWLILWMMSTRLGSSTIVTANTESQLKSRTWAELGKWHTLSMNGHWFERHATLLRPAEWFEKELKTQLKVDTGYYYAQAQLWSEENPDAFAGVHNHNGILVIFDEASGIPESIWTVTEGFFTEPVLDRYWFAMSNPRRNTGAFFECFHKHRDYWRTEHIDSRTIEGTDPKTYQSIIDKYGEDSDEARVEVYGMFPRQGDKQFISRGMVDDAIERELEEDPAAALIMGCDVARYGDDTSVARFRQGRNARFPVYRTKNTDNMTLAHEWAYLIDKYNPDAVCIDMGNGTGVIDRLREMGYRVHEVNFGSKSPEDQWGNFRTYMWDEMRQWLKGACIDRDARLIDDLTAPEYRFQRQSDRMIIEPKEEMKERGFASPDDGDALACTFAVRVARRDLRGHQRRGAGKVASGVDYDIFGP